LELVFEPQLGCWLAGYSLAHYWLVDCLLLLGWASMSSCPLMFDLLLARCLLGSADLPVVVYLQAELLPSPLCRLRVQFCWTKSVQQKHTGPSHCSGTSTCEMFDTQLVDLGFPVRSRHGRYRKNLHNSQTCCRIYPSISQLISQRKASDIQDWPALPLDCLLRAVRW